MDSIRRFKRKKKIKIAIELLEKYLCKDEVGFNFTIEHILPDSEKEEHAKIGNLLPLEEVLNQRCDNLSLEENIEIYKESKFETVKKSLNFMVQILINLILIPEQNF